MDNAIFFFFKHETLAVRMFDRLVEKNEMWAEFDRYFLTKEDIQFIKEQIAGPPDTNDDVCVTRVKINVDNVSFAT